MFRLFRYYSIASAVAIVAVTVVLAVFFRQHEMAGLIASAENQNVVLSQAFANTIWPRFSSYVTTVSEVDGDTLRARPETRQIHEALVTLAAGLPVLKIKIYNLDGLTIYSSQPGQIGADKSNNPGFMASARDGRPASKLSLRDTFSAFSGEVENRSLVESYLPIRRDDGTVEGVFELYTDVTPAVARIDRATTKITVVMLLVLSCLYGVLSLIVRRADRILGRQYRELDHQATERRLAEESLREAHDTLEQRVTERTVELESEIAKHERTAAKLRESEERFKDFAEAASDWFWEQDADLRFTLATSQVYEKSGVEAADHVGKTRRDIVSLGVSEEQWRQHEADLAARRPFRDFTFQRRDPSGDLRDFSISGKPVFDAAGRFKGYRGMARDITEHRRAEKALEASEARLAAILDIAPEAVISIDQREHIVLFNQGAETLFGYAADEVLGKPLDMLLPVRARAIHAKHIESFAHAPESRRAFGERLEICALRKDGSEFPAEAALSKLVQGGELLFTIMLHDISERKRTEEALLASKQQAELANRAKSEFLANMSHELRTPLNAVIGFAQIIQGSLPETGQGPKLREYAGDIASSGQHLLELINDILDLSKIEAGTEELQEEAVEVTEVIGSCISMIKPRAESNELDLITEVVDGLPALYADGRKLRQILINLLSNAVKFTPSGGTVTVRAWHRAGDGHVFQVADTGIGIALEDIPKALARFGQIEDQLNRNYEGTGLGLALTKSLVELHGGSLDLQSTLGVGTTVTVRFPEERVLQRVDEANPAEQDLQEAS
ncbi:MAG: PAS domain S-box protein [Alphaproteobacteria bacterium]